MTVCKEVLVLSGVLVTRCGDQEVISLTAWSSMPSDTLREVCWAALVVLQQCGAQDTSCD